LKINAFKTNFLLIFSNFCSSSFCTNLLSVDSAKQ
jgi:hypothetical protein